MTRRVGGLKPPRASRARVARKKEACRRFTQLTNGFGKNLENHVAAVALYVAFYNFCRPHGTLTPNAKHQTTPTMALGLTDHIWSFGELVAWGCTTEAIANSAGSSE